MGPKIENTDFVTGCQRFTCAEAGPVMADKPPFTPFWSAARHADTRPFLLARGAITRTLQAWFEAQGFTEVETGILQVSPGNETHLHAPRTQLTRPDGERQKKRPGI